MFGNFSYHFAKFVRFAYCSFQIIIFVFANSFVGEESLRINSELQCVEKSVQGDLITGLICVLDLCDDWCLVGVPISKIFVSLVA
jgi:hypothetical protein